MDVRDIIELVNLVSTRDIAELEVAHEGVRVRIVRAIAVAPATSAPVAVERVVAVSSERQATIPAVDEGLVVLKAPIVGTFYRSPSPSAEPYVKVGDHVKKGQLICIVEAMKLMNEIECEEGGAVVEILAEDGQPVEFGQALFRIRPDR